MFGQKCPIPGHENDNIVIKARRHIASMFTTMLLVLMVFLVPILIFVFLRTVTSLVVSGIVINILVVVASIYYLIAATFAFTQWLSYYYDIFILTENEIIDVDQHGIFDRKITEVSLLRVQDVSARIGGFFPTIFNYGDVIAESAGENSQTYIIDNIPNPVIVANKILELHNEHIAKEDRANEVIIADGDLRGKSNSSQPIAQNQSVAQVVQVPPTPIQNNPYQPQKVQESVNLNPIPVNSIGNVAKSSQGDISKDDLDEGGEVKF